MSAPDLSKGSISISKEALSSLPAEEYIGNIWMVETPEQLAIALEKVAGARIVGLDTETRPSFHKGKQYNVALVQLATVDDCFLIRLNKLGMTQELIEFFTDPQILKIGLSLKDDFNNLRKLADFEPANCLELQSYVKKFLISDNSLAKIYGILFDKRISKAQRLTNWEAEELTEGQKQYAALDAKACLNIYNYLKTNSFKPLESKYFSVPSKECQES